MVLWTLQHEAAYVSLQRNGCLCANEQTLCFQPEDGHCYSAYLWLSKQFATKVPSPSPAVRFPIWAWLRREGKSGKPDMRESGHAKRGTPLVRLKIDVPEKEVLLSDFNLWHFVLNYWYLPANESDGEEFDQFLDEHGLTFQALQDFNQQTSDLFYAREKIESSWERIFDISREDDGYLYGSNSRKSIQAIFWRLSASQILSAEHFIAK